MIPGLIGAALVALIGIRWHRRRAALPLPPWRRDYGRVDEATRVRLAIYGK
jgi:hypothetical protein